MGWEGGVGGDGAQPHFLGLGWCLHESHQLQRQQCSSMTRRLEGSVPMCPRKAAQQGLLREGQDDLEKALLPAFMALNLVS